MLRARLEAAGLADQAAEQTPEQLVTALQAASQGLKPELVTSGLLAICASVRPEAQAKLVLALKQNEAAKIRLPADLALLGELFFAPVLSLPDAPDTPAFTLDDFHALSETGQSAESLSRFEDTVGRRVLMDDGKELFIDAQIANMRFDEWGDEGA